MNENQSAGPGGGILIHGRCGSRVLHLAKATVQGVKFVRNEAEEKGGAVSFWHLSSESDLEDVEIEGNRGQGGGLYFEEALVNLKGCRILNNVSTDAFYGGGGILWKRSKPKVRGSTKFSGNKPDDIAEDLR
ncbi:MAG: hypothetical protein ACYTHM_03850 [Planctomycetota bacterium]